MKKIHIMLCLALGILVSGCFTSYVFRSVEQPKTIRNIQT